MQRKERPVFDWSYLLKKDQWPQSSYPKHAGEADPGPGPPDQSGRQGKGERGHPQRRPTEGSQPHSRSVAKVFPENPTSFTQERVTQIHSRHARYNRIERRGNTNVVFFPSLMARVTLSLVSSLPQRLTVPPSTLVPSLSLTLSCFHCLCPPPVSAQVL